MKKPFKVMTNTALASLLATSALVPVLASSAEASVATEIEEAIFSYEDGVNLTIPFDVYAEAYDAEALKVDGFKYIKGNDDKYYSFDIYAEAYDATGDISEAFKLLKGQEITEFKTIPGKIDVDAKKVVADEQPEDRLNETFFYNFAA